MSEVTGSALVDPEARVLLSAWMRAAANGDYDWFRRHLHPDFRYLNAAGGVTTGPQMLAASQMASGTGSGNVYELREAEGHRYSDFLIVVGRYYGRGRIPDAAPVSQELRDRYAGGVEARFSQVWRKEAGQWRCLLLQATAIT
jgi:hypothetical protein